MEILHNVNETLEILLSNSIDILFVQETWLRKSDTPITQQVREAGYDLYMERNHMKIDIGGGVGVIFNTKSAENLNFLERRSGSRGTFIRPW